MTTPERIANNIWLIMLGRFSPVVLMMLVSLIAYFARSTLDELQRGMAELQKDNQQQELKLQDLDSRLTFGRQQREALQANVQNQFGQLTNALDRMNIRLETLNVNVEKLATALNERVPGNGGAK